MTEQLISFETSVLAKAKGFEFTWNDYDLESLEFGRHKWCEYYKDRSKRKAVSTFFLETNHSADQWDEIGVDCPTQSLLQKWLRETHDIYVLIQKGYGWEFYLAGRGINDGTFNTYEEALEAGFIQALQLIK